MRLARSKPFTNGVTAGTTVFTGAGRVTGVLLSAAAAAATMAVYDNTAASGTKLCPTVKVPIDQFGGFMGAPVGFSRGVTVVITGAGAEGTVYID